MRRRAWIETTEFAAVATAEASCDESSARALELPVFCADIRTCGL